MPPCSGEASVSFTSRSRLCVHHDPMAQTTTEQGTLHDLLINKLQILYDVEQEIVKALPKMAEHASDKDLQMGFEQHVEETKGQAKKLEEVFEELGEKAEKMEGESIRGMIADAERMMKELPEGPALDAELAALAQGVEHLEIATYGSAVAWAREMGHDKVADMLADILSEEKETDEKLSKLAESKLNAAANESGMGEEEE